MTKDFVHMYPEKFQTSGFTIYTRATKQRFRISPLWRTFLNLSVFSGQKHLIRVDETRIRKNISAFLIFFRYVRVDVA